jgi:hypothetical protein
MDAFNVGDRVRLSLGRSQPEHNTGDAGTVAVVMPSASSGGEARYQVHMNNDESTLFPVFYAGELELVK